MVRSTNHTLLTVKIKTGTLIEPYAFLVCPAAMSSLYRFLASWRHSSQMTQPVRNLQYRQGSVQARHSFRHCWQYQNSIF